MQSAISVEIFLLRNIFLKKWWKKTYVLSKNVSRIDMQIVDKFAHVETF